MIWVVTRFCKIQFNTTYTKVVFNQTSKTYIYYRIVIYSLTSAPHLYCGITVHIHYLKNPSHFIENSVLFLPVSQ